MSRNINGDDALGVDVLVRIGGDVHDVMIRINLRRSRSDLTDPGRVPRHDDVREQCQTGRDRGHLLGRKHSVNTAAEMSGAGSCDYAACVSGWNWRDVFQFQGISSSSLCAG